MAQDGQKASKLILSDGRTVRSDKLVAQDGQNCNLVPYNIILGILAGALSSSDEAPDGRVAGQSAMVRVHSPIHTAVYAYGKEPSGTPALRVHSSTMCVTDFSDFCGSICTRTGDTPFSRSCHFNLNFQGSLKMMKKL